MYLEFITSPSGMILALFWYVISCFVSASAASEKGRSAVGGFFLGLAFSPIIALLYYCVVPVQAKKTDQDKVLKREHELLKPGRAGSLKAEAKKWLEKGLISQEEYQLIENRADKGEAGTLDDQLDQKIKRLLGV